MNRRRNGILVETETHRKAPKIEGKAWSHIQNPYTRYAELKGFEDGHICYVHIPYKYKRIKQLEAAGWVVVDVFERGAV